VLARSLELAHDQFGHRLEPLPASVAGLVGIFALIVLGSQDLWRIARHYSVIVHESAHALAGWGTGRRVRSMRLESNADGSTEISASGLPAVIIGMAGYLGPSVFGLGAAVLIAQGYIVAVLWLGLIFLVIPLLLVRNAFGAISVILTGVLLFLIIHYGSAGLQTVAAYGLSWYLLLSGVRWVFMHGSGAGDAGILRDLTYIPRFVWATLWLVGTLAALWVGGHLLI
jgi:Peptidase M50B-like